MNEMESQIVCNYPTSPRDSSIHSDKNSLI